MPARWKSVRYRLEWLVLRTLAVIIPSLPHRLVRALGSTLGAVAAHVDRAGRKVALSNLHAAFGEELNRAQRHEIVRQSFQDFSRVMLDLLWSPRLTRENFRDFIVIENEEQFRRDVGPGGSCVFACLHYGNFEWMSHAMAFLGFQTDVVAQEFKNPLLDQTFNELRGTAGNRIVARNGAIVRLYKILKRGGRVALFADLTVPPKGPSAAIECFGLKTSVTLSHVWLSRRTGAPIIPGHCEPLPDGRMRFVLHPKVDYSPETSDAAVAQACWDAFAPYVRAQPAPWLWMYKHWRYRPASADPERYPFYANVSPDFEALLKQTDRGSG